MNGADALPDAFKAQYAWASLRTTMASQIDERTYRDALQHVADRHGALPQLQFLLIDHYHFRGEHAKVIDALERFERAVVEDGVTNLLKCIAGMQGTAPSDAALAHCERSVALEPETENTWWLVAHQLQQRRVGRHSPAIQFVRRPRVIEQNLVELKEFGAQFAKPLTVLSGHRCVRRRRTWRGGCRGICRRKQRVQIEPLGNHANGAVSFTRPLGSRPIPIELNPVSIGIAQIQRFADAVITRAVERDARFAQPTKRFTERRAIGQQHGEVAQSQPSAARRRARTGTLVQLHERRLVLTRAKHRARRVAVEDAHAQGRFVVEDRAAEIGDLEADGTKTSTRW